MASIPYSTSTAPLYLLSPQTCWRCTHISLNVSLMEQLNSTDHSMDTWEAPLITVFHLDTESLVLTLSRWPFSQYFIYLTAHPSNLCPSILMVRKLWRILSKVLQNYREIISLSMPAAAATLSQEATRWVR